MKLYKREKYLKRIRGFYHDTDIIKVISGVRRCGKSCLMQMIADELTESGISQENIFFYNLDRYGYKNIKTADDLEKLLFQKDHPSGTKYIFIDEIQNVEGFEPVINALREEGEYSIFITGSNSYLLSGELATKLTGRYIEFELFTLTFDEYIGMKKMYGKPVSERLDEELDSYILEGGFPRTVQYDSLEDKRIYVRSII
ncbi:MAG: AAA family ATPase, partial [Erysipelotrichaceae bacterium]|nr:AAA family ATPase [Erysipelotrichaceae bacterium]